MREIPLTGGRVTQNVTRKGICVYRPCCANAAFVHRVLRWLEQKQVAAAPRFIGIARDGREITSFLEGAAPDNLGYFGDAQLRAAGKIPNLRKIGVTPWADINMAAEIIGGRYVVSNKPNPAAVAVASLDEDALRRELGGILDACKRHGTRGLDITLKDISTCMGRPENIFRWEEIAMEMVERW